jgi:hypothetical protein
VVDTGCCNLLERLRPGGVSASVTYVGWTATRESEVSADSQPPGAMRHTPGPFFVSVPPRCNPTSKKCGWRTAVIFRRRMDSACVNTVTVGIVEGEGAYKAECFLAKEKRNVVVFWRGWLCRAY